MAGELEHLNPESEMLFATSLATLHGSVCFASGQYAVVLSLDYGIGLFSGLVMGCAA